ncbi:MAG: type II toxin-antitoxin system RelE/ParE family toxin [Candidatus Sulfotelmatobacter sp.]
MKIVWTRKARLHLRAAYDYWSHERSTHAADKMLERIFSAVELLERYPSAGRPGRVPETRELVIASTPFLVAYRARHGKIEILALLHGARKWPEEF